MISKLLLPTEIPTVGLQLCFSIYLRHPNVVWLHVNQVEDSKRWLGKRTTSARIPVGHYHTMPLPRGNLYQAVRKVTGMPRSSFAKLIKISEYQLRYRERVKRTYHLCEVMALFVASGMTWDDYGKLLNDIA